MVGLPWHDGHGSSARQSEAAGAATLEIVKLPSALSGMLGSVSSALPQVLAAAVPLGGGGKLAKLNIVSIDNPIMRVSAQYNPKELQIDKSIPWGHKPQGGQEQSPGAPPASQASASQSSPSPKKGDSPQDDLGLTGEISRIMALELFFDAYEHQGGSVMGHIGMLEGLSSIQMPGSPIESMRRPHHCLVVWGHGMPPFPCVIESLSTTYTVWRASGVPVRATCKLKLKEAITMRRGGGSKPK